MAAVHLTLAFGVKVRIDTPIVMSRSAMNAHLSRAERLINDFLSKASRASLGLLFPTLAVGLTGAKTALTVDRIDTE